MLPLIKRILADFIVLHLLAIFWSCNHEPKINKSVLLWSTYNDSVEVRANQDHENPRMRFKLIESKVLDKNKVFLPLYEEVSKFSEAKYNAMKPLVLEQDIPTIQHHIANGAFTYEDLTLFFLHRIYTYELNRNLNLNTIIALNPEVIKQARELDDNVKDHHLIYGMPILLKDNIGMYGVPTTAGAIALVQNQTKDAFIVQQLKEKGALILGKVNLSEWAYYFCDGCPVGYSAVGGQNLNPYGRGKFETGGSSAGSGSSIAANYAVAAIGTETSGSILSPSSQNSVVGLKPTIGMLSRTGIVPISGTLDTPGPMTKNVVDNAIVLHAMLGEDSLDAKSFVLPDEEALINRIPAKIEDLRFGVIKTLLENDTLYRESIEKLNKAGAEMILFEPLEIRLKGFLHLLNLDMKYDLPAYFKTQVLDKDLVPVASVSDIIAFNKKDSVIRMPYGQARLEGIEKDTVSVEELAKIKIRLKQQGRNFFDTPLQTYDLHGILSVNNKHAGYAAVAEYPAMTIPMGYRASGEPVGLTLITKPRQEVEMLSWAMTIEEIFKIRKLPIGYE